MPSAKSVIPECYIDSNLFNVLLNYEKESVNHTKGNGTVVTKMQRSFANTFCVGIIDEDKRELPQLKKEYDFIEIENINGYFKLFAHKNKLKKHFLIQIVPEIETWICNVAAELGVNLSDFEINANSPKELAKITKAVDKKTDPRFKSLFKHFIKMSNDKDFKPVLELKRIIEMIVNENYTVDINKLKNV